MTKSTYNFQVHTHTHTHTHLGSNQDHQPFYTNSWYGMALLFLQHSHLTQFCHASLPSNYPPAHTSVSAPWSPPLHNHGFFFFSWLSLLPRHTLHQIALCELSRYILWATPNWCPLQVTPYAQTTFRCTSTGYISEQSRHFSLWKNWYLQSR